MKRLRNGRPLRPNGLLQLNGSNALLSGATFWMMDSPWASTGANKFSIELFGAPKLSALGYRLQTSSDYLRLGIHNVFNGPNFSQLIIFKLEAFSAVSSTLSETSFSGTFPSTGGGQFCVTPSGALQFVKDNTVIISTGTTDRIVSTNKVHVAAMSYDGTTCKMVLDGIDVSGSTSAQTIDMGRVGILSKRGTSEETPRPSECYLYGWWPRALNISELLQLTRNIPALMAERRTVWLPHIESTAIKRPQVFTMT